MGSMFSAVHMYQQLPLVEDLEEYFYPIFKKKWDPLFDLQNQIQIREVYEHQKTTDLV